MNELGWKLIYWFCVIVIIFLLSLIGYLAYSATRDTIEPYEPDPAYNRSNLTDKWRNIYLKNILPTANHTLALGEYGYKLSNQTFTFYFFDYYYVDDDGSLVVVYE